MLALHKNPLIYRSWCVSFRPGKFWGLLISVLGVVGLGYLYICMMHYYEHSTVDYSEVFHTFGIFVLAIQVLVAFYATLVMALNSVVTEKLSNTQEFLITLPIRVTDKVIGLSTGSTLSLLAVFLLLVPVGFLSGLAGGLEAGKLIWFYVIMFAGFIAFALTGVATSSGLDKRQWAWVFVLLPFLMLSLSLIAAVDDTDFAAVPLLALSPYGILAASVSDVSDLSLVFGRGDYHFYSFSVPWQLCPLVFYIFLAGLSFATAARRLSKPSGPPLPRWVFMLGFALFQFLLVGFLADSLNAASEKYTIVTWVYFISLFIITLIWSASSTPEYSRLMEWVEKKRHWPVRLLSESFSDIRTPTFIPAAVLWLLATGTIIFIDAVYWHRLSTSKILLLALARLVFIWAYQSLFLLGVQLAPKNGRKLGLIFIAVVIAIPLSFMTIEGLEWLGNATPFGPMEGDALIDGCLLADSSIPKAIYYSLLWGISEFLVFTLLVAWRFRAMLAVSPLRRQPNLPLSKTVR